LYNAWVGLIEVSGFTFCNKSAAAMGIGSDKEVRQSDIFPIVLRMDTPVQPPEHGYASRLCHFVKIRPLYI